MKKQLLGQYSFIKCLNLRKFGIILVTISNENQFVKICNFRFGIYEDI